MCEIDAGTDLVVTIVSHFRASYNYDITLSGCMFGQRVGLLEINIYTDLSTPGCHDCVSQRRQLVSDGCVRLCDNVYGFVRMTTHQTPCCHDLYDSVGN